MRLMVISVMIKIFSLYSTVSDGLKCLIGSKILVIVPENVKKMESVGLANNF